METTPSMTTAEFNARIDALEARVAIWQSRTRAALLVACVALAGAAVLAAVSLQRGLNRFRYGELHARSLVIDGADGSPRARLAGTAEGAQLTLDAADRSRGQISIATARSGTHLSMTTASGASVQIEAETNGASRSQAAVHAMAPGIGASADLTADNAGATMTLGRDTASDGHGAGARMEVSDLGADLALHSDGSARGRVELNAESTLTDVEVTHSEGRQRTESRLSASAQQGYAGTEHETAGVGQYSVASFVGADDAMLSVTDPQHAIATLRTTNGASWASTEDAQHRVWSSPRAGR